MLNHKYCVVSEIREKQDVEKHLQNQVASFFANSFFTLLRNEQHNFFFVFFVFFVCG